MRSHGDGVLGRLTALVRREKLDDVLEALADVRVVALAVGRDGVLLPRDGEERQYRGLTYTSPSDAVMVDVIVYALQAPMVAELITANAWTGRPGDGGVWISPVEQHTDVLTGQTVR